MPITNLAHRRAARITCCACAALLLGACGFWQRITGDTNQSPPPAQTRPLSYGPVAAWPEAPALTDSNDPHGEVEHALEAAMVACNHDEPELDGAGGESDINVQNDAWTQAALIAETASWYAWIEATPSPPDDPVTIEEQVLAREQRTVPPGFLHIYVLNTRERAQVRLYDNAGRLRTQALDEINRLLRDQRADLARPIHPRTVAMLYIVGQYYDAEVEVVSGYRLGGVNASETSRHASGEACDFRIDGVGVRTLARFLESEFANVGVGYYPTSGFVHLDNRQVTYYWVDYSGPGERSRERSRSVDVRADANEDTTLRSFHITERELYQLPPEWRSYGYE